MEINYCIQNPQTFKGLRYKKNIPQIAKKTIESSNTLKNFGKKYNADIDYVKIKSNEGQTHPAFIISNIVPIGIQKIIDKIRGINSKYNFFCLSTSGKSDEDLYNKFINAPTNYVAKKYDSLFGKK